MSSGEVARQVRDGHEEPVLSAQYLQARLTRMRQAMDECRSEVPAALALPSQRDLDTVAERLALGVDHTVVALFGGTGSGKSSLFNALTHLEFADVGARRPTTSQAAACTWGDDAAQLLTFLGVSAHRRIRRDSALDGTDEDDLAGLVLLDVPDYDSVTTAHQLQVDRLVPLADVLVWVLDPQKYADAALHDGYLRQLGARSEDMLVLVNQVDTLPVDSLEHLMDDVRSLLVADGLADVTVLPVSALRGDGLDRVRALLVERVGRESNAARTASAEMDRIATRLLPAAAAGRVHVPPEADAELVDTLVTVCGAGVVEESVRTHLARALPGGLARPEPPARASVQAGQAQWMVRTTASLPSVWRRSVDQAVATVDGLAAQAAEAVASVRLPAPRTAATSMAWWGGLAVMVAAVVAGLALAVTGGGLGALVGAGLAVLVGLVAMWWARRARRRRAEREASVYAARVRERLGAVVAHAMTEPAETVLARHERLWEALRRDRVATVG